jgi:uncharacterized protein DUF1064
VGNRFTGWSPRPKLDSTGKRSTIQGKRPDLDNRFFRSAWEANWARYLNFLQERGEIISWSYEPKEYCFPGPYRRNGYYTPDFRVVERSGRVIHHEVKGWMDVDSRTKLDRMRKHFPAVTIEVIDRKRYSAVKKALSSILPHWE